LVRAVLRIDPELCIQCVKCIPYCPENAIIPRNGQIVIDLDTCVECDACLRASVCPTDAIVRTPLEWPRTLRSVFSSVVAEHKESGVPGRGTEEMKTNDVTGRFRSGDVGFMIDVGRPGIGTRFVDVERIALAVGKLGVEFEPLNPVTFLMADKSTGKLRGDVRMERAHSAIIEFKTNINKAPAVMEALEAVSKKINTVFSVGAASRVESDGSVPLMATLKEMNLRYRPNGKVNLGLGRPLSKW
jgi:NAD-dependent dihydropyrimidine dehydrogenase PreA subunit